MPLHSNSSLNTITSADGRSRILRAASRLFAARGFYGVSISDVAESAGLVKSAIYHHFSSKEELYFAVLNETVRTSRELMEEGARGATWRERLTGIALVLGNLVGPSSHMLSLILEGMAQVEPRNAPRNTLQLEGLRREFVAVIAREIQAGIAAGDLRVVDPESTSICFIGLIAAALQANPGTAVRPSVKFALDIFLNGALRDGAGAVK